MKSTALPAVFYGDPLKALEAAEKISCTGCAFEKELVMFGQKMTVCKKGRGHGRKCKLFVEAK